MKRVGGDVCLEKKANVAGQKAERTYTQNEYTNVELNYTEMDVKYSKNGKYQSV